jgi:hypothetical protein
MYEGLHKLCLFRSGHYLKQLYYFLFIMLLTKSFRQHMLLSKTLYFGAAAKTFQTGPEMKWSRNVNIVS